jgi:hypothetical protein
VEMENWSSTVADNADPAQSPDVFRGRRPPGTSASRQDVPRAQIIHLRGELRGIDSAETEPQNPDQALWRDIHLQRYDDPRAAGAFVKPRDGFHWKRRVQDRQFVGRVFREWTEERYDELVSATNLNPRLDNSTSTSTSTSTSRVPNSETRTDPRCSRYTSISSARH